MGSKLRLWTLSDGSVWSTLKLAETLNISMSTAYHRLRKTDDVSVLLRPVPQLKKKGGKRLYVLDDGSQWTSTMVVKHAGVNMSTASTRLSCYTDPEKVLAPPKHQATKDKTVTAAISERMFFDPLGHWALINKYL